MAEVAISRMIRANVKNGPIGSSDGGEFLAFGGDSTENLRQLAMTTENSLGIGNKLAGDKEPLAVAMVNSLGGGNELAGTIGRAAPRLVAEVAIRSNIQGGIIWVE